MGISNLNIEENRTQSVQEIWDTLAMSCIFEVYLNQRSFGYGNFSVQNIYLINYALDLSKIQQLTTIYLSTDKKIKMYKEYKIKLCFAAGKHNQPTGTNTNFRRERGLGCYDCIDRISRKKRWRTS